MDWYDYPINKNFFFLNAHGEELEKLYEIPKGVRIIMFCYSKELQVCDKFDEYNWSHILLDPGASNNYCDFLKAISGYSSIRDHFCVYDEGDVIRNLNIFSDNEFREGLYRLPVKGYAYDEKTDTIVVSEGTLLSEVQKDKELSEKIGDKRRHVVVDSKRIVKLLKNNQSTGIIQSQVRKIGDKARLSNLINTMKLYSDSFTILLMVCRDRNPDAIIASGGIADKISIGRYVIDEVENYKSRCNLEKLMRGKKLI
jgi:hypothetical protein